MTAIDLAALDLPQLFTPAQAAEILRMLGLPEMTECALRTRAYRRQIPFHLNGRRIRFTASDLRAIAEGHAHKPQPAQDPDTADGPMPAPRQRRRSAARKAARTPGEAWRVDCAEALSPTGRVSTAGQLRLDAKDTAAAEKVANPGAYGPGQHVRTCHGYYVDEQLRPL
jgi:hypothetical protein